MSKILKFLKDHSQVIFRILFISATIYALSNLMEENKRLHSELIGTKEEFKKLTDYSAKLEIQYKDEKAMKEELNREWAKEKDQIEGRVKILAKSLFLVKEEAKKLKQSDLVVNNPKGKSYTYNEIAFKDGPPIGYVLIKTDGSVVSKIYNHVIESKVLVSRDEKTGKYNVVTKTNFVLKSPSLGKGDKNWFNKPYPLKIAGGTALIDPTEKNLNNRLFLWNPKINLGPLFGKDFSFSSSLSLSGYGKTENDLKYKFLSFGVDYNKDRNFGLFFIPVLYRPFEFFSNTYIGPGISTNKNGPSLFMGIQIGL